MQGSAKPFWRVPIEPSKEKISSALLSVGVREADFSFPIYLPSLAFTMVFWSELEQEPYDPEEFVERLAWRTTGANTAAPNNNAKGSANAKTNAASSTDDTALQLHDAFVEAIKDLTQMHEAQKKKCETLEQVS